MRPHALLLTALLAGCQCLQPVSEGQDAGSAPSDAGHDAGVMAPECTTAADCATTAARPPCWFGAAARSCFDRRCVFDCGASPRACTTNAGMCLSCDGGLNTCAGGCGIAQPGETGRLYRHCGDAGAGELVGGYVITYAQGATCNFVITTDAGITGTLDAHGGDDTSVAQLSTEPGVSCTVTTLATALNRTLLGCAQCIYLLESP